MSTTSSKPGLPPVVSAAEFEAAHEAFLRKEKAHTRERDALNAERRRLPMMKIEKEYTFEGPRGKVPFLEIFEGRPQLLLYHFMFAPGKEQGCSGCSMVADNLCHPAHLHARDITLAFVSRATRPEIEAFRQRMGWTVPWYSSFGTSFNEDFGTTTPEGEDFRMSVFLRDGADIFRTYYTLDRGVESLGSSFTLMDLTPYGRQEDWEDTPAGRPKGPRYEWWRHHDRYGVE